MLCPLSQAAHAGVDFQMYFYRIGSGGVQSSCVGAVGRSLNQIVGGEKAGVLRGCIAHNQNFTLDAGFSKRDAFLKSSYGKGTHADPVPVSYTHLDVYKRQEEITSKPAEKLPLTQLYSLF